MKTHQQGVAPDSIRRPEVPPPSGPEFETWIHGLVEGLIPGHRSSERPASSRHRDTPTVPRR